jgi:hypothetical protein
VVAQKRFLPLALAIEDVAAEFLVVPVVGSDLGHPLAHPKRPIVFLHGQQYAGLAQGAGDQAGKHPPLAADEVQRPLVASPLQGLVDQPVVGALVIGLQLQGSFIGADSVVGLIQGEVQRSDRPPGPGAIGLHLLEGFRRLQSVEDPVAVRQQGDLLGADRGHDRVGLKQRSQNF